MSRGTIICPCDLTGIMAAPWVAAGYDAILIDPQHHDGISTSESMTRVGNVIDTPVVWDLLRSIHNPVFVASFPPCTDLAVSGARWFDSKRTIDPAFQFKAMQVVWQCHVISEILGVPYMIENPVSQISSFWRKPDFFFHPHQFTGYEPDDNYTKKTCLWTGGGFVMPNEFKSVDVGAPDDRIHKMAPGENRANLRSATPRGFAEAVFQANAPHLKALREAA